MSQEIHSKFKSPDVVTVLKYVDQCFSTAGPRPGTGPWQQLYRAARIRQFSFLKIFNE
jgi:hypothetical protein